MSSHRKGGSATRAIQKHLSRLILLGNTMALLWLYACCIVTWIPCDEHPRLSLLTITFPIALAICLLFIPTWALVKRKLTWLPLAGILPCMGYVLDYYPLKFGYEEGWEGLMVVSWNTHSMGGSENSDVSADYLKNINADIICLQETDLNASSWDSLRAEMARQGYEYFSEKGHTLFSKLHIILSDTITYETRGNVSTWHLLAQGNDTIIVINNHLESNRISPEIKEEYAMVLNKPEYKSAKESGRSILQLMAQSAYYRGNQTKALLQFIQEHEGKHMIVCGDFNDTPISYAYQTISRQMKNAYRDSGCGIGVSYNETGFWVRIDHIFFSKEGTSNHTHIDRTIDTSDHFPIVSWVNFEQNQQ